MARQTSDVEPFRTVAAQTSRQHGSLPGARRDLEALQLLDDPHQAGRTVELRARGDVLPGEEHAQEIPRRDGLDRRAQAPLRIVVDPREQAPRTELLARGRAPAPLGALEASTQDEPFRLERREADLDETRPHREARRECRRVDRTGRLEMPAQDVGDGDVLTDRRRIFGLRRARARCTCIFCICARCIPDCCRVRSGRDRAPDDERAIQSSARGPPSAPNCPAP